jgi:hypothetical protein
MAAAWNKKEIVYLTRIRSHDQLHTSWLTVSLLKEDIKNTWLEYLEIKAYIFFHKYFFN